MRVQQYKGAPLRLPPSTAAFIARKNNVLLAILLLLLIVPGSSALKDGCQYWIYDDTDSDGIKDGPLGPGYTAYGPEHWDEVKEDCFRDMNFDWKTVKEASIDFDDNECESTNLFKLQKGTDSTPSSDNEKGQSPKLLQADGRCTDRHRMYQKNRLCTYGDVDYKITPYSVRADLQSCADRPQVDYSRSTKLQNLHYFEFKVPAEHQMLKDGTTHTFVAELNMAHVGTESDNNELSDINIVYVLGNDDECDDEVQDHIIFWQRAMQDMYAACKYPVNAWRADDLCRVRAVINDEDIDEGPTPSPTPAPSDPPTDTPTSSPSSAPSDSTREPTSSTVSADVPTASPTSSPSSVPSSNPSAVPSSAPSTSEPTTSPSTSPSSSTSSPTIDDDSIQSAVTPMMKGNFIANGVMFDLVAHVGITLTSIDVHLYAPEAMIEVYTKSGSAEDYPNDADAWTLLGKATVQSSGYGMRTPLPKSIFDPPIVFEAGERRSFYVTTTDPNDKIRYSKSTDDGKSTGDMYGGNDHVSFGVGYANKYKFQFAWRNRYFEGAVNYIPTDDPDPTTPTSWPTLAPTTSDDAGGGEGMMRHVTTGLNGTYIGHGVMFDVLAHADLTIMSLGIHQYTPTALVTVWSKEGSSKGFQRDPSAWTLLGTRPQLVDGMGYGKVTTLPRALFEPISMKVGETRAFYVTVMHRDQRMRYSKSLTTPTGQVYAGNSDLSFIVGYANRYPFGYAWPDRQANVGVDYVLDGTGTVINPPPMKPKPPKKPTVDKEVVATMDGGFINAGSMFDIHAKTDLRILALEINLYSATADVAVFTKSGSCQGYQTDPSAWTRIGTARGVQSRGYKVRTPLPRGTFDPVVVLEGEIRGFYVTVVNDDDGGEGKISYSPGTVGLGVPYAGNDDLDVLTGYANTAYPPQFAWADRRANAWVTYTVDDGSTRARRLTAVVDGEDSLACDTISEGTCRRCCGGTISHNRNLEGDSNSQNKALLLRGRKERRPVVEDSCTAIDCDKCCGKVGGATEAQVADRKRQQQKFAQLQDLVLSSANAGINEQRHRKLAISLDDRVSPYKMYTKTGTPYMYKYEGSQTHPPCYQTTEHRVLYQPRKLCPKQLDTLERMIAGYLDGRCKMATVGRMRDDGSCKVDVNRPVQFHDHGDSSVAMKECLAWQ